MFKINSGAFSVMGSRHAQNDDTILFNDLEGIYMVCDGVSESGQGKFASTFISKYISDKLINANKDFRENADQPSPTRRLQEMHLILQSAFAESQNALKEMAKKNDQYQYASTTCTVLWFYERFALIGHIGDSRAYLYRKGKLYQLTKDHVGYDELIKLGVDPEMAKKQPVSKMLTRALGKSSFNQPDVLKIEFEDLDSIFICSDGFYSALKDPKQMGAFVQELVSEKPLLSWIEKASVETGDDSSMIHMHFHLGEKTETEIPQLEVNASDRLGLLKNTPLCKYFDFSQMSHVAAICGLENFASGSMVVEENKPGDCMYILAKGKLEVLRNGVSLKHLEEGEFFGEISLIQRSNRTASVIVKEDSVLLALQRSDLEEVFKKDPLIETRFYKAMLETVLDRVVALNDKIAMS